MRSFHGVLVGSGLALHLLTFVLVVQQSDAFQTSTLPSRTTKNIYPTGIFALHAAKRKKQQSNKRKPRFSQQVYKEEQSQRQEQQQPKGRRNAAGRRPTTLSDLSQYAAGTPYPLQKQRSSSNQPKRRKKSSTYISPNVPWNSGKSMEELESIMTKRWGTTDFSSRGSEDKFDDDDDYEIVYEDDDDNDNSNDDKYVDDDDDGDENTGGGNFFFRQPSKQQDYYDPDDAGYESPSRNTKRKEKQQTSKRRKKGTDLNFDNIVAPQPVGGRGTTATNNREQEDFFFRSNSQATSASADPAARNMIQPPLPPSSPLNKRGETQQQQRQGDQQKSPKKPLKPFAKDENGKPLLLTLDQAQQNFKEMVVAARDNKIDEEEDVVDLVWDTPSKTWEELGITSSVLLENLQRMQCASPLAVQDKACPSIITGQDVLVGTYTGSGKTLAFLVPLIERVLITSSQQHQQQQSPVQILVVVPGRELASQVVTVARQLLEGTGIKAMLAIGGTGFARNLQDIRQKKPTIVIGTPGRIAELIVGRPGDKSGRLKVPHLQSLVLDEFDALLEYKPHRDPTAAIVGALKQRHGDALQSILCSATATDMLNSPKLNQYLRPGFAQAMADRDDVFVTSAADDDDDDDEDHDSNSNKSALIPRVSRTVIHGVIHVDHRRFALDTLRRILHTDPMPQQILVFAENARKVGIVVEKLEAMGIVAAPLCGGAKSEKVDRAEVAKALREGYVGIVVATEMAARGLDAPLLTHVINLDLPTDASHYAHRAGRCGRGGRPGVVINLTTSPQERSVPQKFADKLGIAMQTVEARAGKLHIVEDDASSQSS